MSTRSILSALALVLAVTGCTTDRSTAPSQDAAPAAPARVAPAASAERLGVEGRANGTPYLAADGRRVVVAWTATAGGRTDVYAATSDDAGVVFSDPGRVNDRDGDADVYGEQPPRVTMRRVGGAGPVPVSVAWTSKRDGRSVVMLSRSVDGGRTFPPAAPLHADGLDGGRGWQSLVEGPAGLHGVWLDGRTSDSGGHTGHQVPAAAPARHAHGHDPMALFTGGWSDTGRQPERRLTPGVCECCKTALAVAPDGTLYAAWRHIYPGSIRDIAVARSVDAGLTFADPVRVSEDRWEIDGCPDDGPAAAVDASGRLHLVWPTLVPGPEPAVGIFYAFSDDGRRFSPRLRLDAAGSRDPSHPQLAVHPDGRVAVAWDEIKDGGRVVVLRRSTRGHRDGESTFGEPLDLADAASNSYPVVAAVDGGYLVAWTSGSTDDSTIALRRLADSGP